MMGVPNIKLQELPQTNHHYSIPTMPTKKYPKQQNLNPDHEWLTHQDSMPTGTHMHPMLSIHRGSQILHQSNEKCNPPYTCTWRFNETIEPQESGMKKYAKTTN